jgi:hypothetical protein
MRKIVRISVVGLIAAPLVLGASGVASAAEQAAPAKRGGSTNLLGLGGGDGLLGTGLLGDGRSDKKGKKGKKSKKGKGKHQANSILGLELLGGDGLLGTGLLGDDEGLLGLDLGGEGGLLGTGLLGGDDRRDRDKGNGKRHRGSSDDNNDDFPFDDARAR